ncbi:MAG: histidinol-phosphate aminotransferase [Gemmatimonadetes bacterium]|nr:histidinol-phosphate aminotransferase [Gemmatimonadota bacterium]
MITDDRDTERLARAAVRALPLYAPDVTPCAVDVSDNINLWGTPPAALRALASAPPAQLSRYPSLYSTPLRDAVLRYVGLSNASGIGVVTGCGSDDVLDAAMRAFGEAGDEIVFAAPTFSMIPIFGRLNGMVPVGLPMTSAYDADPQQLVDRRAKITYLCTPNNPTSTALSREAVEYVAANAAGVVIIDEAYAEFAPHTFIDLVTTHERVLVTRTFSKAFGLAGLRVGFGVGSETLVSMVTRARGPYKVNALAEAATLAALGDGPDALGWVARHAALAVQCRERLAVELRALGLEPVPSAANFLFIPTPRAPALARALRDRGVLVRALSGLPRDLRVLEASQGHALRIGVGPWEVMETVLRSLAEALACA